MPKAMALESDNANDFLAELRTKSDIISCATCGCLPDCCCTTGCNNNNCTRFDSCGGFCGCVYSNCCQARYVVPISSFIDDPLFFFRHRIPGTSTNLH